MGMNIIFNLGFIMLDWVYLVTIDDTDQEYFYRYGYVIGDNYMRYFFRTLYDVPVR